MKTDLTISLKKFSAFILNNYQDAFIKKVRELTEHSPGNLLNYISELSEEDKLDFFRVPCLAYLIHLSLNKPEEHIEESMLQWKKGSIYHQNHKINIDDILKILSLRKEALIRMVPFFTRDQKDTIYLILQLENYHRKIEHKVVELYSKNIKEDNFDEIIKEVNEKVPGIFYVYDLKLRKLIYINKHINKCIGYTDQELYNLEKEIIEFIIHPEDHQKIKSVYQKLYRHKDQEGIELYLRIKNEYGSYNNYLSRHKIFKIDENGNPSQIIGSIQEISNGNLKLTSPTDTNTLETLSLAKIGNFKWTKENNQIFVSEEFFKILKYQPNEIKVTISTLFKLILPEDRLQFKNAFKKIIQSEKVSSEFRAVGKDGQVITLFGEANIQRLYNGQITYIFGYLQDITDRKNQKENLEKLNNQLEEIILERTTELRKSEERFRFLAECSPQIVWITNEDGKIDYVNEKWTIYSGLSMEMTMKNGLLEVIHPEDIFKLTEVWEKCQAEGKQFEMLLRLKRKEDQMYRWHITRAIPLKGLNNKVVKWFDTSTDIHDYKNAEESIKLQSKILDSMAEGVCVTEENGQILYTNPSEEKIFGYESGALLGKKINLLNNYPEEQQKVILEKIQSKIKEKGFWLGELNSIKQDGTAFTTYSRISSLTINETKYFVYVQEDITESKVHHENQKLLDKISIILSSSLDYKVTIKRVANLIIPALADWCVIDLINSKNKIQRIEVAHANPTLKPLASSLKKFPPPIHANHNPFIQAINSGQPFFEQKISAQTLQNISINEEHHKLIQTIQPKSIISIPLKVRDKNLGLLTLVLTESNKTYNEQDLILTTELARRVSYAIENALLYKNAEEALTNNRISLSNLASAKEELSRMNEELSHKNNELQKINNDLDNFIYTASHDLKSPISNLEGLLSILSEDLLNDEGKEILPMIHTSLNRLKNIIKELTEISKIQKNIEQDKENVSLSELTQEIKLSLEDEIRNYNILIETDFSEVPEFFFSKKNLRSIIYNLLSNGIKYRSSKPDSYVKIYTKRETEGLILTVEDNGLGIPKPHQDKIFNMFKRLHDHVEGSGIGLYIVKRIIENEGGKIEVESQEGIGSIFRIWLPDSSKNYVPVLRA